MNVETKSRFGFCALPAARVILKISIVKHTSRH